LRRHKTVFLVRISYDYHVDGGVDLIENVFGIGYNHHLGGADMSIEITVPPQGVSCYIFYNRFAGNADLDRRIRLINILLYLIDFKVANPIQEHDISVLHELLNLLTGLFPHYG